MSSEKRVIDTYYMARNKWGHYICEKSTGAFTSLRFFGEQYATVAGVEAAIARYLDKWKDKFQAGERPVRKDFKIVKVTVRR